ncbi:MAG: hypothetical protein NVV82_19415 [Sporocytophaga sp.]|nr:hypothetical protein [Sporocytophaga sp.]
MIKELVIKNEYCRVILSNGILHMHFNSDLYITLEVAKICVKERIRTFGNKSYPMLIYPGKNAHISPRARKYLSKKEATQFISAGAIIVRNNIHKHLAMVFITIDRPIIPTRFFTDVHQALSWLEYYKFKNLN